MYSAGDFSTNVLRYSLPEFRTADESQIRWILKPQKVLDTKKCSPSSDLDKIVRLMEGPYMENLRVSASDDADALSNLELVHSSHPEYHPPGTKNDDTTTISVTIACFFW